MVQCPLSTRLCWILNNMVIPTCSERYPIQTVNHSCGGASRSSVKIFFACNSCSSVLYLIKRVDIFLGMGVPSCRSVVEDWLDRDTVGC